MSARTLEISPAHIFKRPTADSIWLGPAQQAALSHLSSPSACKLLLGPNSSGKSTVLDHFCTHQRGDCIVLKLRGPMPSAGSVLTELLETVQLQAAGLTLTDQRNLLDLFLKQRSSQKKKVVIAVDNVELFGDAAWYEIERLKRLTFEKSACVEIVACGESFVNSNRFDEDEFDGTETIVYELPVPQTKEVLEYLKWRLGQFDLPMLFTKTAVELVAKTTQGRFAAVDVVCQVALLLLQQSGRKRIDTRLVKDAVANLESRAQSSGGTTMMRRIASHLFENRQRTALRSGKMAISCNGTVVSELELKPRLFIGRGCHNDLCFSNPYLSRNHAVIVGSNEGYSIVDLNSVNGVLVNGELHSRTELHDGDVVTLGPYVLKIEGVEEELIEVDRLLAQTA